MLKVADKKRSQTVYDGKVKQIVQQICAIWDELYDFERLFKDNIDKFPRLNTSIAAYCYKLVRPNSTTIEVWHLNTESEPDRLLCVVEYVREEISE